MIISNERIERLAALDRQALVELIAAAMLAGRNQSTAYWSDPTWRQLVLDARVELSGIDPLTPRWAIAHEKTS